MNVDDDKRIMRKEWQFEQQCVLSFQHEILIDPWWCPLHGECNLNRTVVYCWDISLHHELDDEFHLWRKEKPNQFFLELIRYLSSRTQRKTRRENTSWTKDSSFWGNINERLTNDIIPRKFNNFLTTLTKGTQEIIRICFFTIVRVTIIKRMKLEIIWMNSIRIPNLNSERNKNWAALSALSIPFSPWTNFIEFDNEPKPTTKPVRNLLNGKQTKKNDRDR